MKPCIGEKLESRRPELSALGWVMVATEAGAALFSRTKSGATKKAPTITFEVSDEIYSHHDFTGPEPVEVMRRTDQKFLVQAPGYGHRYKDQDQAIDAFLELAKRKPPL